MAEILSVTYRISGNSIAPILGAIDVSAMNNARAVVSGIPVGMKYVAELTASSNDGKTTCTGMSEFDVAEGKTAQTMIVLGCRATPIGTGGSGSGGTGGRGGAPGADGGVDASSAMDAPVGTGGMVGASGGAVGSGGASGSGGAAASGGASGTGGTAATGGAAAGGNGGAAAGGRGGMGGAGGGGGKAGATAGAGGGGGKGGSANGGTAGSAVGGSTSTGGAGTGGAGTGGAGTGGAGTGGAGTGGAPACVPTHCRGAVCDQCTADNCITATDTCDAIADLADRQLCETVYACFLANACVSQGDPLKCWCGTNPTTCVSSNAEPTKANGPCLDVIIMAAKLTQATYDATTIKERFVSTNYPLGYAVNETSCRGNFCSTECGVP